MRHMPYAATTTLLLAAVFACSPRDRQETAARTDTAAADIRDAAREGADEVRDNAREGADEVRDDARDARDYAYAERADFRRDIDLRLKNLDEQIAELQRDTKSGVDKARDSALVNIRAARKAVDRNLAHLSVASETSWDEAKSAVNRSVYALQEAVHRELPDAKPMGGTGRS
jgi:cell division septum initiation protein DivIVA